jgi:Flp pilus assembly protein protease CpaA
VSLFENVIFLLFAINVSIDDVKNHSIRNHKLILLLGITVLSSFTSLSENVNPLAGFQFLAVLSLLHFASNRHGQSDGVGFGDVKLIAVLAFAFFDSGLKSIAIFFFALWLILMVHVSLYFLIYRKFPRRLALAPDIFLASGLYLYTPIVLLLPQ